MSHFVLKSQKLSRLLFSRRIIILSLLLIVCGTLSAFNYGTLRTTSPFNDGPINAIAVPPGTQLPAYQITSTSSIEMGSGYAPGIIAPFSNGNPSYQNGSGSGDGEGSSDDDIIYDGDDYGENSDPDFVPVGESWIMLAFAAMAAVVIRLRKKQKA
jgi:hypothetical protein